MNFIESLIFYSQAQKVVAYGFVTCGGLLLTGSALSFIFFSDASPLWHGFKISLLIFGLFGLVGGVGYLQFNSEIKNQIESNYNQSPDAELLVENQRIKKVVNDFKRYQYVFVGIVIIALLAILLASPFWVGFSFPIAFLFLVVLLIEAHSKSSIDQHAQIVSTLVGELKQ
ncbi:MAG: hypothetical protein JKX92_10925 [Porticoccaceae bacterium]|nr:hypothetical protein [Porticoccaceae bacterium]